MQSYLVRVFVAAFALALIILFIAMGLIHLFNRGLPIPTPGLLILMAVAFVVSAAFLERHKVGSIIWSMLASIMGTAIILLITGGILYLSSDVISGDVIGWEELLTYLAVALIVAMTLLNYLKRSMGDMDY
jgi:hypothetical protein